MYIVIAFSQNVLNTNSERYTMTSYCLRFQAAFNVLDKQSPSPYFVSQAKTLPAVASADAIAANRVPWHNFFKEFGT